MSNSQARIGRTLYPAARRGAIVVAIALGVALATAPAPAGAQGSVGDRTRVHTMIGADDGIAPPPAGDDALELSLSQAVELALKKNLDLQIQRFDRTTSALAVEQNRGIYDLFASLSVSLSESNSPNSTQLEGAAVVSADSRSYSLGLSQLVPTGGTGGLQLSADRAGTNSTNAFINPQYSAVDGLRFSQPLLRGFGRLSTELPILQARINSSVGRELFEQEATRVVQSVENAYWGLVEARQQLEVAQQSLALAQELDNRNRVQVEVGTLAPIELVASEATVATREEEIIRARTNVGDAADRLLELLNLDRQRYWDLEVVPTTDPETAAIDIELEEAIDTALSERPELASSRLAVESSELSAKVARRDKLPQLDLTLSYGSTGLGGRGFIPDPETGELIPVDSDLVDAFDDAFGFDFDNWTLALDVSYPLQNRDARARSEIADLELERSKTALSRQELSVVTEVRSAARGVESAVQQIESARVSRRLQERNLEAEQKRYENGMSTSFQVLEIQEDLATARSNAVRAETGYRRALIDYLRAIGSLDDEVGIQIDTTVQESDR